MAEKVQNIGGIIKFVHPYDARIVAVDLNRFSIPQVKLLETYIKKFGTYFSYTIFVEAL